jgi:hypothetical protein
MSRFLGEPVQAGTNELLVLLWLLVTVGSSVHRLFLIHLGSFGETAIVLDIVGGLALGSRGTAVVLDVVDLVSGSQAPGDVCDSINPSRFNGRGVIQTLSRKGRARLRGRVQGIEGRVLAGRVQVDEDKVLGIGDRGSGSRGGGGRRPVPLGSADRGLGFSFDRSEPLLVHETLHEFLVDPFIGGPAAVAHQLVTFVPNLLDGGAQGSYKGCQFVFVRL